MWRSAVKGSGVSTVSFRQSTDNASTPVLTKFYERLVDAGPKEYIGSSAGIGLQPSHLTSKQTARPADQPASAVQQAYTEWSRSTGVATAALVCDALEVTPLDLVSTAGLQKQKMEKTALPCLSGCKWDALISQLVWRRHKTYIISHPTATPAVESCWQLHPSTGRILTPSMLCVTG